MSRRQSYARASWDRRGLQSGSRNHATRQRGALRKDPGARVVMYATDIS